MFHDVMLSVLASGFRAFSPLHGLSLLVVAAAVVGLVRAGRRARRRGRERGFTRAVAAAGLAVFALQQVHALGFDWQPRHSLPLHVCDLAGLVGPLALLLRWRGLRLTLYFWGFGLTVWGLLTPTLAVGPGDVKFWLFWANHGGVMAMAAYDVAIGGYRPDARDWGLAVLVSMAYVAVVLPLNLAHPGWNYGYVGAGSVDARTPLDVLPAWPWRVLWIEAMGAGMMAAAWLPWVWVGRRKK
ncbi:MAG: TIGR02206 family membrane protein [Planctomycetota bacterium]